MCRCYHLKYLDLLFGLVKCEGGEWVCDERVSAEWANVRQASVEAQSASPRNRTYFLKELDMVRRIAQGKLPSL